MRAESQFTPEQESQKFDAIVVMPYSSNIGTNGRIRLSYFSAQAIHAGYHLWEHGLAPKIIIPGENVFGPNQKSTTELMAQYLIQKCVPGSAIIGMHNLNNTVFQLEAVKEIQDTTNLNNLLIVSCNWHGQRVNERQQQFGINAKISEVEKVLDEYHPKTKREVLLEVPASKREKIHDEQIRKNPLLRNPLVQKFAVQIFGPRVVDLHESTYARKKELEMMIVDLHNRLLSLTPSR